MTLHITEKTGETNLSKTKACQLVTPNISIIKAEDRDADIKAVLEDGQALAALGITAGRVLELAGY